MNNNESKDENKQEEINLAKTTLILIGLLIVAISWLVVTIGLIVVLFKTNDSFIVNVLLGISFLFTSIRELNDFLKKQCTTIDEDVQRIEEYYGDI